MPIGELLLFSLFFRNSFWPKKQPMQKAMVRRRLSEYGVCRDTETEGDIHSSEKTCSIIWQENLDFLRV